MKHLLLVLLGFSAVSLTTACKSDRTSEMRESDTVRLDITGMTCKNCPPRVQSALQSVDGVERVEVDYDHRTAVVTCRGYCDHRALIAALEKADYGGRVRE